MCPSFADSESSAPSDSPDNSLRAADQTPLAAPAGGVYTQRFTVPFEYPVVFTDQSLRPENGDLSWAICGREPNQQHRVFVVLDDGLVRAWPNLGNDVRGYFQHHAQRVELVGEPLVLAGGEACKNDAQLIDQLHRDFQQAHLDRHCFVVIFGGGALQDAVGFAAATAHRGLRVVRLPTTVLAQNDSGVGVKNGINAFDTKNFLGTFAPPWAVVNDFSFLTTLERRDRIAGMAEAVKVALIRDAAFFGWLENNTPELCDFDPTAVKHMVRRTAELHMEHIATSGDPFETGSTRPLDYGHWAAHKLESMTNYELRHGEAVAIGLALDSLYSANIGLLQPSEARRLCMLLHRLGFVLYHPALEQRTGERPLVLDGLREFREHLGGDLTLTLLRGVGNAIEVHEVNEPAMLAALTQLKTLPGA